MNDLPLCSLTPDAHDAKVSVDCELGFTYIDHSENN